MTNREFFSAIIAENAVVTDELKAHAEAALAKLDATNAARKGKISPKEQAKRDENEALMKSIVETCLNDEPQTATTIAEMNEGMSVQKASSLLRMAVAAGLAVQTEIKVTGKGTQKAYQIA